ncbi:MAG: DNA polymerase III subunit alpha [Bacillota bacterium]
MAGAFIHLHNHTEYSLLDGAGRITGLVSQAVQQGAPALAITDHGVMYGAMDFYKEAKNNGINPIIGCEVYVARRTRLDKSPQLDDSPYHLVLLAENQTGYYNLMHLVSTAFMDGFYYKPRIDRDLLSRHHQGLIALSGCLAGEVPRQLQAENYQGALQAAGFYRDLFGAGGYYLELQDHGLEEQKRLNRDLVRLGRELDVPLVATNDVHYVQRQDAGIHDILLCIQTGKNLEDTDRLRFPTREFYLKTPEEMEELFREVPEALSNTVRIAERCQLEFRLGEMHLPRYVVPESYTLDTFLEEECWRGLQRRFPQPEDQVAERLRYELGVIRQMGFSGYFLIVWDLVNFARRKGIRVGPGRGSAAGSLVAYVLGITDIDPLKHGLLFERFLNPERVSMPDIDIDFCFERRGEVIDYVTQKYGSDHVAQIITFGTMAARAAVRDVGRAMNIPYPQVDKVAKLIPGELGITISRALETSPELREHCHSDELIQQLVENARALEGMPRHASTHAAGVVISEEPLVHYLPLQKTTEGVATTQYPMETVEQLGLLKMDLLGLRTLTVIEKALQLIRLTGGDALPMEDIPLDDTRTYQMLGAGETTGVFQLESSGMRNILKNLKPERFEDIVALVALYRPGPLGSGMVEDFIQRKHGTTRVEYLHPVLEPILRETYGVILYQEQVMRIASDLAGFTLGQADLLRRAMGKKKPEVIAGLKQNFLQGAREKDVDEHSAREIFELVAHFAGYGFNKSHSAAYALIAYQTAYLKATYPVEFMASLLTSVMSNSDKGPIYLEECRRLGIEILPPDVNESLVDFTVIGKKIRFGLGAVKNVGRGAIGSIVSAREEKKFDSLLDFCQRVDLRQTNRRVLESLIRCGAFASLGLFRAQLLEMLDDCLEVAQRIQADRFSGQLSLMDLVGGEELNLSHVKIPKIAEFSQQDMLAMEREALGFYVSGHPLAHYQQLFRLRGARYIGELAELPDAAQVTLGGIATQVRKTVTRRGETMAYVEFEDTTGTLEVIVFPGVLARTGQLLEKGRILLVDARLNVQDEGLKVIAENIQPVDNLCPAVIISLDGVDNRDALLNIRNILENYPGKAPVQLYFPNMKKLLLIDSRWWVEPGPELLKELESLLGSGTVRVEGGVI